MGSLSETMTVILAGGKGSRLEPLTRDRAKPAVPFGGAYRIIDFTLSNCLNSGLRKLLILTQYKAISLDRHINMAWQPYFCRELGEFLDVLPPQQRIDDQWYQGTADAVYQNIYSLEKLRPEYVLILAGDHIYKMDYAEMIEFHKQQGADLTIAALPVDRESAKSFGVMQVDGTNRLTGFEEKPVDPKPVPGKSDEYLASMGIYVFTARLLFELLLRDANNRQSSHDFGKNIIDDSIAPRLCVPVYRQESQSSGLLAGCWNDRFLLRREHGFDQRRSAIEHVRSRLADPDLSGELSPAQVRFCGFRVSQRGASWSGDRQHCLRWFDHFWRESESQYHWK
jgi:glucose-1-phosphate adenylyltransferase